MRGDAIQSARVDCLEDQGWRSSAGWHFWFTGSRAIPLPTSQLLLCRGKRSVGLTDGPEQCRRLPPMFDQCVAVLKGKHIQEGEALHKRGDGWRGGWCIWRISRPHRLVEDFYLCCTCPEARLSYPPSAVVRSHALPTGPRQETSHQPPAATQQRQTRRSARRPASQQDPRPKEEQKSSDQIHTHAVLSIVHRHFGGPLQITPTRVQPVCQGEGPKGGVSQVLAKAVSGGWKSGWLAVEWTEAVAGLIVPLATLIPPRSLLMAKGSAGAEGAPTHASPATRSCRYARRSVSDCRRFQSQNGTDTTRYPKASSCRRFKRVAPAATKPWGSRTKCVGPSTSTTTRRSCSSMSTL